MLYSSLHEVQKRTPEKKDRKNSFVVNKAMYINFAALQWVLSPQ